MTEPTGASRVITVSDVVPPIQNEAADPGGGFDETWAGTAVDNVVSLTSLISVKVWAVDHVMEHVAAAP